MCGIAGFAFGPASRSAPREALQALGTRMCDVIRHRGPDDAGLWVDHGVGLGMRRLSIIDLAGGRQPIAGEDGSVRVVFNGEIYNFRELRATLEALGHRFATASDTEVIVHAYESWGLDAFARLRGMFGIALWDGQARRLVLARDRVGIKPVYYAVRGDDLYYGSELKSLLCAPDVPRALDPEALDHFLSFLYTPVDRSILQGICKLPPAHLLTWSDGHIEVKRYWTPPAVEVAPRSDADAAASLEQVLADAVRSHLISDVPLGAFLSGGVDSSLVVALMARESGTRVKTFSIGFDEPAFDELAHARRVAEHCGTDHHEFIVRPDAVSILDQLIAHFDEPFADASAIPTWYVSELARRHVTVVLSGDGGDELFGGYDRYLPHPRVAQFDRFVPRVGRPVAGRLGQALPLGVPGRNFLRHVARDAAGRYVDSIRYFGRDEKAALLAPEVRAALDGPDPETRLVQHLDALEHLPWPSRMMRLDFETYLPEDVLVKVDRMSMAHSIESRVPLLDNEVVDFAMALPPEFKIRHGRRKHLLKEVASRLLPTGLVDRRKQGFGVPLGIWFRGGLRTLFADTLLSSSCRTRGYFQPAFVRQLVDEHLSGRRDHTLRLWQLVVLERWHQQYLDSSSIPVATLALPAAG